MTRTLLAALLLPVALGAQAPAGPISKGSMLVDGSASIGTTSSTGSQTVTGISLSPEVLYFVRDRLALGGQLGLSYSKASGATTTGWSLGPALKYYIANPESKTLPFVGASVAYATNSFKAGTTDSDQTSTIFEGVGGITWLLARHVGLSGELFASTRSSESSSTLSPTTSKFTQTGFGLRFSISAFVF